MDLQCEVCFYPYDECSHQPKCLPCGHTICNECVESPGLGGKCPTCRKEFISGSSEIPINFAIIQVMGKAHQTPGPIKPQLGICIRAGRKLVQQLQQLVPVAVEKLNGLLDSFAAQLLETEEDLKKLENEAGLYEGPDLVQKQMELEDRLRLLTTQSCSVVAEEVGASWKASTPAGTDDPTILGLLLLLLREADQLQKVEDCANLSADPPYVVGPPWIPLPVAHSVLTIKETDLQEGHLNMNKLLQDKNRWRGVRRLENLQGDDSERLLRVLAPYLEELSTTEKSATPAVMEEVRKMKSLRRLLASCDVSLSGYPDLPLQLEGLSISMPEENQLRCLQHMARLRSLNVWDYKGQDVHFPPARARLLWLKVEMSARRKTTLLSLIRSYAPSLRELHVFCVTDQDGPLTDWHFPDLARDLAASGLTALRRLVLQRGKKCERIDACLLQRRTIRDSLPTRPDVTCNVCKIALDDWE